jgi:hypothetical protein
VGQPRRGIPRVLRQLGLAGPLAADARRRLSKLDPTNRIEGTILAIIIALIIIKISIITNITIPIIMLIIIISLNHLPSL